MWISWAFFCESKGFFAAAGFFPSGQGRILDGFERRAPLTPNKI
jgi:hypothetical protein